MLYNLSSIIQKGTHDIKQDFFKLLSQKKEEKKRKEKRKTTNVQS